MSIKRNPTNETIWNADHYHIKRSSFTSMLDSKSINRRTEIRYAEGGTGRNLPLGVHVEDDDPIAGGLDKGPEGLLVDLRHLPDGRHGRLQVRPRHDGGPSVAAGGGQGLAWGSPVGAAQEPVQRGRRLVATRRRRR
ncbi:hypothetical protein BHE74_00031886 [Ensete ventricosum]|nr:hypothetical protein BHE74_00031886 [Ensete ventricosum]